MVLDAFYGGVYHNQRHQCRRCRPGLFAEHPNHFAELLLLPDAARCISVRMGICQALVRIFFWRKGVLHC
jgi:hypothetical protein